MRFAGMYRCHHGNDGHLPVVGGALDLFDRCRFCDLRILRDHQTRFYRAIDHSWVISEEPW